MRVLSALLMMGLLHLAPLPALAQSYPGYDAITVNDKAALLSDDEDAALRDMLNGLRQQTDVEMTVLTLRRQADYAPDESLESFATGLFNHWGIGDATRNDGVLILVLSEDRAMRIELGAGFGSAWNREAARVIDDHFLPAFAEGAYGRGLLEGSQATIDEIVLPFVAGDTAPRRHGVEALWVFGGFLMMVFTLAGVPVLRQRLRRCGQCGARGLEITDRVVQPASGAVPGMGERRLHCPSCGHVELQKTVIPVKRDRRRGSGGSGGSFGGGRSSGGGASGRW